MTEGPLGWCRWVVEPAARSAADAATGAGARVAFHVKRWWGAGNSVPRGIPASVVPAAPHPPVTVWPAFRVGGRGGRSSNRPLSPAPVAALPVPPAPFAAVVSPGVEFCLRSALLTPMVVAFSWPRWCFLPQRCPCPDGGSTRSRPSFRRWPWFRLRSSFRRWARFRRWPSFRRWPRLFRQHCRSTSTVCFTPVARLPGVRPCPLVPLRGGAPGRVLPVVPAAGARLLHDPLARGDTVGSRVVPPPGWYRLPGGTDSPVPPTRRWYHCADGTAAFPSAPLPRR